MKKLLLVLLLLTPIVNAKPSIQKLEDSHAAGACNTFLSQLEYENIKPHAYWSELAKVMGMNNLEFLVFCKRAVALYKKRVAKPKGGKL